MRPRVILHNAVSVDGRLTGFPANLEVYYELAGRFKEDVTLAGSRTLLESPQGDLLGREPEEIPEAPPVDPRDPRPLLAVPDSGDRIKNWALLRSFPFWRDVLALAASDAPAGQIARFRRQRIPYFLSGRTKVDLAASLASIGAKFGAGTVRVDGGGRLNSALLRAGLADEISLLVHPQCVGGVSPKTLFTADDNPSAGDPIELELAGSEVLSGGLVWLRYNVVRRAPAGPPEND